MYAYLDNAFASGHIKEPRDIWRHTEVLDHRLSTPIHFKECVQDIPVFRRAVKSLEGTWVTHPTLAFQYSMAQEYEKDASKAAGFREGGSLYKYRKGAAANLSMTYWFS